MSFAEGNALGDEIIGGLGGEKRGIGCGAAETRLFELSCGDGASGNTRHRESLIMGVEERLFVLLQIALIARGKALQRDEQREERGRDAAGFPADQFPGIGIFFLRHQAAAGGIFVGQDEETETRRGEEDHVLGEAREMAREDGESEKIIESEIAATDGIQAIARDAGEAKIRGEGAAVHRKRATGKRAGAERAGVGGMGREGEAIEVVKKGFGVGEKKMGEQDGLGELHVRHARHGNTEMAVRLIDQRGDKSSDSVLHLAAGGFDEHAEFGDDHFVAAAAGVEFVGERTEDFGERGFDEMVDVLGFRGIEPGGLSKRALFDAIERGHQLFRFFRSENFYFFEGADPGAIESQLEGQQAAVEGERTLEFPELFVGGAIKAPAPHFFLAGLAHEDDPPARASVAAGTVMGRANRLMKPSASFGL